MFKIIIMGGTLQKDYPGELTRLKIQFGKTQIFL